MNIIKCEGMDEPIVGTWDIADDGTFNIQEYMVQNQWYSFIDGKERLTYLRLMNDLVIQFTRTKP